MRVSVKWTVLSTTFFAFFLFVLIQIQKIWRKRDALFNSNKSSTLRDTNRTERLTRNHIKKTNCCKTQIRTETTLSQFRRSPCLLADIRRHFWRFIVVDKVELSCCFSSRVVSSTLINRRSLVSERRRLSKTDPILFVRFWKGCFEKPQQG